MTLAELQALADRYATRYGDTPEITQSRRAALLEELAALDTHPASNRAAWQRRQQDQAIRAAQDELAADARRAA